MSPPGKRTIEITPSAPALIQSLRGFGYSPETALADLIDNSITGNANSIDLNLDWNEGNPVVAVLDDGCGMDDSGLISAMCFGGPGPLAERSSADLGRFGLGMKTASLSQCRRVTVISRRESCTSALAWDVDEVDARGRWEAIIPEPLPEVPLKQQLLDRRHGTLVLWDRMDPLGGLSGLDKETFFLRLQEIRAHLSMAFHRYLGGDARRVTIALNNRRVRPWDPFQRSHSATIKMREERIRKGNSSQLVTAYVLPHRDRFENEAEYEAAGGPGGWTARQGFYVYRAKRLLVPGSWLGLGGTRAWTRDESSKLARIAIDLPTELDADWRIDVRKSQARPPGAIRSRLTAIAALCRDKAREVFAWRGQRSPTQAQTPAGPPIWIAQAGGIAPRYRINREHPAVNALVSRTGSNAKLLEALLTLCERSVPVERIWLDFSESEGAPLPELDSSDIAALARQLAELATTLPSELTTAQQVDVLVRYLPGNQGPLRLALLRLLETTV